MEKSLFKIIIVFYILIAIFGIINSVRLSKKEKIFTVAKIYDRSAIGKSGRTYYFNYYLDGKEYRGSTNGLYKFMTNRNGLIYVDVLKNDFTQYHVLSLHKVPECLTIRDVPGGGWNTIPANPCVGVRETK